MDLFLSFQGEGKGINIAKGDASKEILIYCRSFIHIMSILWGSSGGVRIRLDGMPNMLGVASKILLAGV